MIVPFWMKIEGIKAIVGMVEKMSRCNFGVEKLCGDLSIPADNGRISVHWL